MVELEKIKIELELLTGLSLTKKTRQREYVYIRSVYHKLAREQTSYSLSLIGGFLNLDHATALHAIKYTFQQAIDNDEISRKAYSLFSNSDLSNEIKEISKLKDFVDCLELENLKLKTINYLLKTKSKMLTDNELKYRLLSESNKKKYDLRVGAILRMMNVGERKENTKFEYIQCQV